MLVTLLAEEARTQARTLLATTGVCVLVFLTSLGMNQLELPVLSEFFRAVAVLAIVVLPVALGVEMVAEYWQSMYGARGYLTMSLPVRGRTILAAKLIHAVVVMTMALALSVALLLAWGTCVAGGDGVRALLSEVLSGTWSGMVVFMLVSALLGSLFLLVDVLAIVSISSQGRWNHLGVGAPVIGLVLFYLFNQVVGLVAVLLIPMSFDLSTGDLVWRPMLPEFIRSVRTGADPTVVGAGAVLVGLILAVVMTWWAVRAVERHTCLR